MKRWHSQAGMSLIETLVAVAVLGAVVAGAGLQMKNVRERLNIERRHQTMDALKTYLHAVFSNEENIVASAPRWDMSELRNCLTSTSSGVQNCKDVLKATVPLYIGGDLSSPVSGPGVRYTYDGNSCMTANCGPLSVQSVVYAYCTSGGTSPTNRPLTTCVSPRYLTIEFTLYDEQRKVTLGREVLEIAMNGFQNVQEMIFMCNSGVPGMVMHGLSLGGEALCTPLNTLKYADSLVSGDINVIPKDCRPTTNVGGAEVPVADSDEFYVGGISPTGELTCMKKTW